MGTVYFDVCCIVFFKVADAFDGSRVFGLRGGCRLWPFWGAMPFWPRGWVPARVGIAIVQCRASRGPSRIRSSPGSLYGRAVGTSLLCGGELVMHFGENKQHKTCIRKEQANHVSPIIRHIFKMCLGTQAKVAAPNTSRRHAN